MTLSKYRVNQCFFFAFNCLVKFGKKKKEKVLSYKRMNFTKMSFRIGYLKYFKQVEILTYISKMNFTAN